MEQAGRNLGLQPSFQGAYLHHFAIFDICNNHLHKRKLFHHWTSPFYSPIVTHFSCWLTNRPSNTKSRKRWKSSRPPQSVSAGLGKQGNIHRACLQLLQVKWISAPALQTLKSLLRGLTWAQSHIPSRWSPQHSVSSRLAFEPAPAMGAVGWTTFRDVERARSCDGPDPAPRSAGSPVLSVASPHNASRDFHPGSHAHKSMDSWSVYHYQFYTDVVRSAVRKIFHN